MSAIVVGFVQVIKTTLNLKSRYVPIISIVISLIVILAYTFFEHLPTTWKVVETGIIVGLTSCGLWSGAKATIGK